MASRRLIGLKLEKWMIWAALIGALYVTRHLFPVIFLTFILTYIGNTVVNAMTRRWPWRRTNVVIVSVAFLLLLSGAALMVVPRMFAETRHLAVLYLASEPAEQQGPPAPGEPAPAEETMLDRQVRQYVDSFAVAVVGRESFESFADSDAYEAFVVRVEEGVRNFVPKVIAGVREFVNSSIAIVLQFFISIILSFLILWDLPRLRENVQSLSQGGTAEVYDEIAPGMTAFATILGRAFEAQTLIACVNAVLTSVGFLILGIPSIALLATIVFFCSYIPVVGVMLSTVPAALLALKTGGITLVLWLIVMVLVVHAIEAYALNPLIYGRHMKMHPVAILAILLVGEHLFGIWGLLLGVPLAAFLWTHVIKGREAAPAT